MYRILSASKDTYITNKIINNRFRATDANLGQAGTLDLFKLYNESTISGEEKPVELSRLLIKFDLDEVTKMHNDKIIDIGSDSFSAQLKLTDIYGGQTTPSGFKIISFPLSQSFGEGPGYDVVSYTDVGIANWVTASYVNSTTNLWNQTGGRASGSLGLPNLDVIVSGTVHENDGLINLSSEMFFKTGEEDLLLNVTNFVSASAKNLIPNHGFLIALSASYEKDNKTYFVKRFASRNTLNANIRPKLIIKYNDAIHDNHENFEFDTTGSLYLNNFSRNVLTNLLSGSSGTEITGENCIILKIQTGSFSKQFNVSQALRGTSKKATATVVVSDNPVNDQTFILEDSLTNKTQFTFNTENNIVSAGSRNIGIASALGNNTTIATRIQNAINNDSINVTAAAAGTNVVLTQDFAGDLGNTTLDLSGVSNVALSTGTGFSGGSYDGLAGIYSASFAISSFDSNLYDHVIASGSITFDEIWSNHNETITYLSSSLKIKNTRRNKIDLGEQRIIARILNLRHRYKDTEKVRLRVFVENADRELILRKKPYETPSELYDQMYYRVRDSETDDIIIPFDLNATKLSNDTKAMYFDFYMNSIPIGRTYVFDFLIKINNFDVIIKDAASNFIVEQ